MLSQDPVCIRHLVVVLGDQLNLDSAAWDDFDSDLDLAWMAEVDAESTHVWSHRARIALFLSAMRHFARTLTDQGIPLLYRKLTAEPDGSTLGKLLETAIVAHRPKAVVCVEPGDYRVRKELEDVCRKQGVRMEFREDRSFFCSKKRFEEHCQGRKSLRLEFFYREMRREQEVLMDGDQPEGGSWNYDKENRQAFGKSGPGDVPLLRFKPDALTLQVLDEVSRRFSSHPGSLEHFDWPVDPSEARECLAFFIRHHLPVFGRHQDAMWTDQPFLHHSRLSAAMNLKLISAREVVQAVEHAYRGKKAPISAAEGFIRQILGWREFVRGIYHRFMPEYGELNALGAQGDLPGFYWTGKTRMNCLSQAVGQSLEQGYAHHIQRLMVTGLFSLLWGTQPRKIHEWYLAIYVDAVEWVELPNTLGMSQFADGGVMGSKPYIASGKYISRMSNYCSGCEFDPEDSESAKACPFTTFYWEFIQKHSELLRKNPRIGAQVLNWDRMTPLRKQRILERAKVSRDLIQRQLI